MRSFTIETLHDGGLKKQFNVVSIIILTDQEKLKHVYFKDDKPPSLILNLEQNQCDLKTAFVTDISIISFLNYIENCVSKDEPIKLHGPKYEALRNT